MEADLFFLTRVDIGTGFDQEMGDLVPGPIQSVNQKQLRDRKEVQVIDASVTENGTSDHVDIGIRLGVH